ncbi:winged helix-turn-helix domain-containing protein [Streptomyces sp. SBR177]
MGGARPRGVAGGRPAAAAVGAGHPGPGRAVGLPAAPADRHPRRVRGAGPAAGHRARRRARLRRVLLPGPDGGAVPAALSDRPGGRVRGARRRVRRLVGGGDRPVLAGDAPARRGRGPGPRPHLRDRGRRRALQRSGEPGALGAPGARTHQVPRRGVRGGERRLVLVPLVFAEGCRLYSTDDPEVLAVSFQARGAAALREPVEPAAEDRLGLLLGRGRAAVLRELGAPLTTVGLADRLALAPSTVSEHLSLLAGAGVVTRHRVGRSVYYQLTDTGRSLLALLAGEGVTARAA